MRDQIVIFVTVTNCHKFEFATEFFALFSFLALLSRIGLVTFWSQMSQIVTLSIVIGTHLFLFLFRLKWFGMNEIRQKIPNVSSVSVFYLESGSERL